MSTRAVYDSTGSSAPYTLEVTAKELILSRRRVWEEGEVHIPLHAIDAVEIRSEPNRICLWIAFVFWGSAAVGALLLFMFSALPTPEDLLGAILVQVATTLLGLLAYLLGLTTVLSVTSVGGRRYRGLMFGRGQPA